jgi:cytoskeletal protein CcmA (bactofilin family)
MFDKKNDTTREINSVFRPAKGSSRVVVGEGVTIKGEITNASEVQIDGIADITVKTDNLTVGASGILTGTIESDNVDIWGKVDGDIKISNTLTIQELGIASGKIEYAKMQIKLGGEITGDLIRNEKVKKIRPEQKDDLGNNKPLQDALDK